MFLLAPSNCWLCFHFKEERYAQAVRSLEFDRELGPYALDQFKEWKSLSNYITQSTIERIRKCTWSHLLHSRTNTLILLYILSSFLLVCSGVVSHIPFTLCYGIAYKYHGITPLPSNRQIHMLCYLCTYMKSGYWYFLLVETYQCRWDVILLLAN